jgi:hypothetical protein
LTVFPINDIVRSRMNDIVKGNKAISNGGYVGFLGLEVNTGNQGWTDLPSRASSTRCLEEPAVATPLVEAKPGPSTEEAALLRCPEDQDCAAGGFASRIFDCQEGCGFRGCAACMDIHEAEPHWNDSATMREMVCDTGRVL